MRKGIYADIRKGKPVEPRHLVPLVTYLRTMGFPTSAHSIAFAEYLRSLGIDRPGDLSYASIAERLLVTNSEPNRGTPDSRDVPCQTSSAPRISRRPRPEG